MDTAETILPPPPETSSEEDGSPSVIRARRLVSIRQKWEDGVGIVYFQKLPAQDLIDSGIPIEELEKNGLLKAARYEQIPAQCSMTRMAKYLTENYGKKIGKEYFTEQISLWIENEGAPGPGANRYLSSDQFIKWFLENKWDGGATNGGGDSIIAEGTIAKNKREVYAAERELIELEKTKRKFDTQWMLTDAHDFCIEGAATLARQVMLSMLKRVAELAKQAARESGADEALTEKIIAALRPKLDDDFELGQSDLTKRYEELDVAAHEFSETKKAELKVKKL